MVISNMIKKKSKDKIVRDTEMWKTENSSKLRKKLDPYSRSKFKFKFQEAYEELEDDIEDGFDINIDDSTPLSSAVDKIKTRLDSNLGYQQVVRVVPSAGRGRTFDPKFIARLEAVDGGMYKMNEYDRRLVMDSSFERKMYDANTFPWTDMRGILAKLLAQVLPMVEIKINELKIGNWLDHGGGRKRVESVSMTASGDYYIRLDDASCAYIDKDEEVLIVKA